MYPIPAGTFVTDIKNTIHWDGAKAETGPCILMLVGEGPMVSGALCAQGCQQAARRPGLRAARRSNIATDFLSAAAHRGATRAAHPMPRGTV